MLGGHLGVNLSAGVVVEEEFKISVLKNIYNAVHDGSGSSHGDDFVRGCSELARTPTTTTLVVTKLWTTVSLEQAGWPMCHTRSWPAYANSSQQTSINQTPADTSAGPDFGTGYFNNGQFDLGQEASEGLYENHGEDFDYQNTGVSKKVWTTIL